MKPQRASYSDFARKGLGSGLVWAALWLALDRYIGGNERSTPELVGNLIGHGLIFMAIGLTLAHCINWVTARIRARG